ncbi:hypothetical protein HDU96_001035 [Phlyctochytrium bullatum]|nr:hypothetical protein HDU96_001035 [Phlyctochytrium bullatum]
MPTNEDLKTLADMNSRTSCPRCEGYGFVHDSIEKHDKGERVRCKKCASCRVCGGSGVVVGKLPCRPCKSRGYLHPSNSFAKEHSASENMRCPDCVECRDCHGFGAIDRKAKPPKKPQAPQPAAPVGGPSPYYPQQPLIQGIPPYRPGGPPGAPTPAAPVPGGINPAGLPGAPPVLNPYAPLIGAVPGAVAPPMAGGMPTAMAGAMTTQLPSVESESSDESADETVVFNEDLLKPKSCPRCEGRGWKHDTSSKHDKIPTVRCKQCASCKACSATGQVQGKIACPSCETRGFIHASKERDHDAPDKLRCFFCKTCPQCTGIGIVENPAVIEQERLRAKLKAKRERREARRKAKEMAEALNAQGQAVASMVPALGPQQQKHLLMSVGLMLQQQQKAAAAGMVLPQPSLQMLMTAAAAASGMVPPIPVPPVLNVSLVPWSVVAKGAGVELPSPESEPSVSESGTESEPEAEDEGDEGDDAEKPEKPENPEKVPEPERMLHVAEIPGVGYVPVEQLLRMTVPMLPGGIAPPPVVEVPQAPRPPVSALSETKRAAVLRDVWG